MYTDLRQHLKTLEEKGLLYRIDREINKDTELHPLVRWQFRGGLSEEERKAFLFENVTDAKGKKYDIPVVVGAYAASKYIYAIGLGGKPEEILAKWEHAMRHPVDPVFVTDAPAQEVVHTGDELTRVGLGQFPIPISTPGFDCAPYFTCSALVTKDIDTGVENIGNYRGQLKGPNRIGLHFSTKKKDGYIHWLKAKKHGLSALPCALVVGSPPVIAATSAASIPPGVDEHTVSGGLAGEPIRVVKCKTVDIFVAAEAELVIEGLMPTDYLEPEAPFGESHGYVNPRALSHIINVTAITHRKNCIYPSWISQVTPSESSVIKRDAENALFLMYLKDERRISSVTRVVMHEPLTNLRKVIIIQMKKPTKEQVWRALYSAIVRDARVGKIVIAVDEDIDPENMDAVFWAMAYRMKPHEDTQIVPYRYKGHGPPFTASEVEEEEMTATDSALLMDATLKEPFPPVSLPKRAFMEKAKQIWEELGLPKLKPQTPWFGYSLGQWTEEWDEEARLAVQGEYYMTGEKLQSRRVKV